MLGRVLTALAASGILLSACGDTRPFYSPEAAKQVGKACLEQVNAVGTYSFNAGQHSTNYESRLPRAAPIITGLDGGDGTQEGADAINACINRRAQQDLMLTPSASGGAITDQQTYDPSSTSGGTAAATATVASTSSTVPRRTATTSFGCPKYADVLHGGKLYCTR
jgi:hypothetical protein